MLTREEAIENVKRIEKEKEACVSDLYFDGFMDLRGLLDDIISLIGVDNQHLFIEVVKKIKEEQKTKE